ncbi:MAG: hypothetical protein HN468_22535 [Desulfobacula sp.]|jgi:ABC-type bacteriocin/lantibiotic exporter with double-glycine peptidase domain|uniref:hypothetical protein n=1 Tax=Desulfobacula sp. TaxID=2593537 RepID=UPI001EB8BF12|nr:hypothetical protein [Desulfobacula sp.]
MESDSYIKISEKAKSAQATISDHILECLALITGLLNQAISATSLASGLPLPNEGMTDELAVRAAKRAGFFARSLSISLADISNMTLPYASQFPASWPDFHDISQCNNNSS